jgi:alpha/beta superfamily hydrolase
MTATETMLRFGPRADLFGVLHTPAARPRCVVVFCPPFAEEKKCSYRTFVEAARAFAGDAVAGFRFDYFGTGDSDGEFRAFTSDRAAADIAAAAEEARRRTDGVPVVLLGLRLGGTLALAAAHQTGADHVILWQPVVSGKRFFDLTMKRQMLRRQLIGGAEANQDAEDVIDLDGFPLSRAAAEELRGLDAAAAARALDGPVRLLQISHAADLSREFRPLADALGDRLVFAAVRCEPFWNRIDRADTAPVIQQTAAWLAECGRQPADNA